MRETIAKRLSAAKQTIPHYQLCATVNVEKLLDMRKEVNARLAAEKSDIKVINLYYTQLKETQQIKIVTLRRKMYKVDLIAERDHLQTIFGYRHILVRLG